MEHQWDMEYMVANETSDNYSYPLGPENILFGKYVVHGDDNCSEPPSGSAYTSVDLSPQSAQPQHRPVGPHFAFGGGSMSIDSDHTDIDFESLSTSPSNSLQGHKTVVNMPLSASQAGSWPYCYPSIDQNAVHTNPCDRSFRVPPEQFLLANEALHINSHGTAQPRGNVTALHCQDVGNDNLSDESFRNYHNYFPTTFADQSPCNDPWSSEGRPRYPHIPLTDMLLFGPESDPLNAYLTLGYGWESPQTFAYLKSPNFAESPSASQSMFVGRPSPTQDAGVHTSESSLLMASIEIPLTSDMPRNARQTDGEFSHNQAGVQTRTMQATGLQHNTYDYELSSSDLAIDDALEKSSPVSEEPNSDWILPTATATPSLSPYRTPVFVQFTMDPVIHASGVEPQSQRRGKFGGRRPGSHLAPAKAAKTKIMRDEVACWLCCLQRDECTAGSICARCQKRSLRPQSDNGLGCDRTKLMDLTVYFLPDLMTRVHKPEALKAFCKEHIQRWSSVPIQVSFRCGRGLPPLPCEVYKFEPRTAELLRQFQYMVNPHTKRLERHEKSCPPLAMMQLDKPDRRRYEGYVNEIVDDHMVHFAHICFDDESNDFQTRLLLLMCSFKPELKDEVQLLRTIFRLIVVRYMMSRKFVISDESQDQAFRELPDYQLGVYGKYCSPRMANRQLKFLFCALHRDIMHEVLKRLQQILRSSRGCGKWLSAFVAMIGLAMVHEDTQKTVHITADSNYAQGLCTEREAEREAERACQIIDDRFMFITNLFRWKYNRGFNPFQNANQEKSIEVLGERAMGFVWGMRSLMNDNFEYLESRRYVGISTEKKEMYTSRLVARFLLSFFNSLST